MNKDQHFSLALVTGASSGIGEAISHLLASKGINLIITGRDVAKLNETAKKLSQVSVTVVPADLANNDERNVLIKKIQEMTPDLVINNAGLGSYGDILTHSTADQMNIVHVNAVAVIEIAIEAARSLTKANKPGVIMNISSAAAFQEIFPGFTIYASTKGFVNQFTQSFDVEMQPYGIRVLAACPGVIATNFQLRASKNRSRPKSTEQIMAPQFAAKEIWKQIENKQVIRIFDWRYRLVTFLSKFVPEKILIAQVRKFTNSRKE